ncbi:MULTISPECIES: hypothetical protein [Nocardiopsis]|uniref:RING-type E3 ubiquitin transferase n=1 Tax=Nocardiopsis alba TaxID=53437 RepID=A0A7K2IRK0_9ACTN|nr:MULTISPECIES: hypothetical protein [Nocardiopsis]MEC3892562.1 hypothetical protein [Nocardiopsis sp. LDBS1602]MYR32506.1 hypothetical protein [Nocardiopsis alba]
MLLVIGVALLAIAAVLLPLTIIGLRRWQRQRGLARLLPSALADREGQRVTLTGVAAPGPGGGPIESGLAGVECVWHGHEVLRHYRPLARDQVEGQVVERAFDSIADYGSDDLFGLVGEGRPADAERIYVDPDGTEPRDAELCLKRLVGRPQPGVAAAADDLLSRVRSPISGVFRGETIEFEYREWVIRQGARVRVTGLLRVVDGRVVLTAPDEGGLVIEHGVRERPSRVSPRRTEALALLTAFMVCLVVGAALTVAGLPLG